MGLEMELERKQWRDDGVAVLRRWRPKVAAWGRRHREGDRRRGVAMSAAAVAAAAARMRAAVAAVGLLPRPFVSSHSRGRRLLSFLK